MQFLISILFLRHSKELNSCQTEFQIFCASSHPNHLPRHSKRLYSHIFIQKYIIFYHLNFSRIYIFLVFYHYEFFLYHLRIGSLRSYDPNRIETDLSKSDTPIRTMKRLMQEISSAEHLKEGDEGCQKGARSKLHISLQERS